MKKLTLMMKIPSHPNIEYYQSKINKNAYKFDQVFGYLEHEIVTYVFIVLKYYLQFVNIWIAKKSHIFKVWRTIWTLMRQIEYRVANRKGKL